MKTQLQTIRRKDRELKEFATRINQLQKENNELQGDIDEYKSLAEQWQNTDWQNPDLTQVFSPETLSIFNSIEYSCQSEDTQTQPLTPNSQAMYDSIVNGLVESTSAE